MAPDADEHVKTLTFPKGMLANVLVCFFVVVFFVCFFG